MFVAEKILLDASFSAARAKLARLAEGGLMLWAAEGAYGEGTAGLSRDGATGSGAGISRLSQVQLGDVAGADGGARLALRWEAIGPGGGLFPALDADLTLTPCGDEACILALNGVYRSPPGMAGEQASVLTLAGAYQPPDSTVRTELDRSVWLRCAAATVHAFLARLGCALAHPAGLAEPGCGRRYAGCGPPGAASVPAGGAVIRPLRSPVLRSLVLRSTVPGRQPGRPAGG